MTELVIGAGVSAINMAPGAAETGNKVIPIENRPCTGEGITHLCKYLAILHFPACGLQVNRTRLAAKPGSAMSARVGLTSVFGGEGNGNAEIYRDEINAKFGSNFEMPVVYYRQLTSVACGRGAHDPALDGKINRLKNWRR